MKTTKHILTLDLKNDIDLIQSYVEYHKKVWSEIKKSILDSGILQMEIFLLDFRLCMVIEVDESFSFERKAQMDAQNPKVREWEELMETYQQVDGDGSKWKLMDKIFDLTEN